MEQWIAGLSAVVAVASAILSGWFSHRATRLAEMSARDQYLESVRDWAEDTVTVTTSIQRLLRDSCPEENFEGERCDLRTALSAQVEKGRWFFLNVLQERVGTTKEAAYRGLRQPVLDALVDIYDALDELNWESRATRIQQVRASHRLFVSEVQRLLDPNRRDSTYGNMLERYRDLERLAEGWTRRAVGS